MNPLTPEEFEYLINTHRKNVFLNFLVAALCALSCYVNILAYQEGAGGLTKFCIFSNAILAGVFLYESWKSFRRMAELHQDMEDQKNKPPKE